MSKEMGGGAHTNNFAKFDRGSNSDTTRTYLVIHNNNVLVGS